MQFGLQLHADRGVDAVLAEARLADELGYDSVWTGDHLLPIGKDPPPDTPLETLTLMTAIGATTQRVRLGFAMLNPSFRNPALLAKMLATMDQITHGRLICAIGAGWFEDEYAAYAIPFVEDHDERVAQEREVIVLLRQLWTSASVTFEGKYARVSNLTLTPRPQQQPHPPIWIGGNSPATQALVAELGDGWVLLSRGEIGPVLAEARARPDWPRQRALTIVGGAQYEPANSLPERLQQLEGLGVNYVRMTFAEPEQQRLFAEQYLTLASARPSR